MPSPRIPLRFAFITGFPGVIARNLTLKILKERSRAKIAVLVQKRELKKAQALLIQWPKAYRDRIEILIGDITYMDLGLSGVEVRRLQESVSHLFHAAGLKDNGNPREAYLAVNVEGVRHVMTLAATFKKLKFALHLSSAFVSGARSGVITEDELSEGQKFRSTYEESKYLGELAALEFSNVLPLSIIRPSIIVGSGQNIPGFPDSIDGLYAFAMWLVAAPSALPIPIDKGAKGPLHLVHLNYVIATMFYLSTLQRAPNTFHIVDPNPLSSYHVFRLIARHAGRTLPTLPVGGLWFKRFLSSGLFSRWAGGSSVSAIGLDHLAVYNSRNTYALLEDSDIKCPPIDTYLDDLIAQVRQDGRHVDLRSKVIELSKSFRRDSLHRRGTSE